MIDPCVELGSPQKIIVASFREDGGSCRLSTSPLLFELEFCIYPYSKGVGVSCLRMTRTQDSHFYGVILYKETHTVLPSDQMPSGVLLYGTA